jgi:hypothetical protein
MKPRANGLIAMAHVLDVQRSADFYALLGMEIKGSLGDGFGALRWAHLSCESAHLMLARASAPIIADQQAVLFYLYSPDLVALREHLLANSVKVSAITYPDYMRKGEIRLEDLDGYVLLVGQAD